MKAIFFIIGAIIISGVTSSVISEAFKSFATRHHHMNKRAVSKEEFIKRQHKFAETMKMVSSLGRFRALGPEPRSDIVAFEEILDDLGLPHDNLEPLFHTHDEMVTDDDLVTVIEEELEKITPPTDEPIPLSKLSTFDDAQGVNETGVIEEISKTETDVANKTQDNSGDEIPVVKVELPPAVINSSQQNESSDVAQDRSDVISERMQQIIVGGDEEDVENSEDVPEEVSETDVPKKTQDNSGEENPESPNVKVEPEAKETDVSEEVSKTETDVPKKPQENSGGEEISDKVERPPNVASFLTSFINTFG